MMPHPAMGGSKGKDVRRRFSGLTEDQREEVLGLVRPRSHPRYPARFGDVGRFGTNTVDQLIGLIEVALAQYVATVQRSASWPSAKAVRADARKKRAAIVAAIAVLDAHPAMSSKELRAGLQGVADALGELHELTDSRGPLPLWAQRVLLLALNDIYSTTKDVELDEGLGDRCEFLRAVAAYVGVELPQGDDVLARRWINLPIAPEDDLDEAIHSGDVIKSEGPEP